MNCHVCGSTTLLPIVNGGDFSLISSDIRPAKGKLELVVCNECGVLQKKLDSDWVDAVEQVYASYTINHQSGGADPLLFNSAYGQAPRAEILVRHLEHLAVLQSWGSMLDIGCANGNVLQCFGRSFPQWTMHGMERSPFWRDTILAIPGVDAYFSSLEELGTQRFDLIVMSHVLEHIPDPSSYLARLLGHLTENGLLCIAVPDIRQNPVDLFVLDHCSHFDARSLGNVLMRGGFDPEAHCANIVSKEIITLVRPRQIDGRPADAQRPAFSMTLAEVAERYLVLCAGLVQFARSQRDASPIFGLMGSSTAAAWLYGELNGAVDFFVDEDPQRIGKNLFDKAILSMDRVPSGACLFIPMSDKTACSIIARSRRNDIRFSYYAENRVDEMVHHVTGQ